MRNYVEEIEGAYRVTGTRVSLDSIVYSFREGQSPESIVQSLPVLDLEQVYGAITYYLAHRSEVDAYLKQADRDYEVARQTERDADPAFYEKLEEARRQRVSAR